MAMLVRLMPTNKFHCVTNSSALVQSPVKICGSLPINLFVSGGPPLPGDPVGPPGACCYIMAGTFT